MFQLPKLMLNINLVSPPFFLKNYSYKFLIICFISSKAFAERYTYTRSSTLFIFIETNRYLKKSNHEQTDFMSAKS